MQIEKCGVKNELRKEINKEKWGNERERKREMY